MRSWPAAPRWSLAGQIVALQIVIIIVVVAIMLGFPTAFTLMGMGMLFTWLAYDRDITRTLDLMVQSAFKVMGNDVLIAVPLFVFMGYLVERANLIEKLFKSLHLALVRLPGSLAVATIFTCAVFATATGIVGAVVTLMGLLALPSMLKAGYDTKISAGSITAGGCLGILIPPSVLLIVYGATAGVSVVKLYAGAFFPGLMLAGLYILYVIVLAKIKPKLMPPLPESERHVPLHAVNERVQERFGDRALPALVRAIKGRSNVAVPMSDLLRQLFVTLLPALAKVAAAAFIAALTMALLGLAGGGRLGNFGDVGVDQWTFGPAVFCWFAAIGALTVVMIGGVGKGAMPGPQRVLPPAPPPSVRPDEIPEPDEIRIAGTPVWRSRSRCTTGKIASSGLLPGANRVSKVIGLRVARS